jgi:hypothetical protein
MNLEHSNKSSDSDADNSEDRDSALGQVAAKSSEEELQKAPWVSQEEAVIQEVRL